MAKGSHGTYKFIPPPPLPEFYMPAKKHTVTTSSSSSSSSSSSTKEIDTDAKAFDEVPNSIDGAYDGKPKGATLYQGPSAPLWTIPPAQTRCAHEVPPLAIYHICRVCLRTRSPRYHREHPIPINGLPPPPGICRRCRVTTIEETKRVAEIVTESESNKIKIGFIQPFVRDEDIISNDEMKRINTQKYLERLAKDKQPHREIRYRHVKVKGERDDPPLSRRTKVTFTRDTEQDDEDEPPAKPSTRSIKTETRVHAKASNDATMESTNKIKAVDVRKMDSSKASISNKASTSTSGSSSSSETVKNSTPVSKLAQPSCTGSDVRKIAREEIDRYRDEYWNSVQHDSNFRRIAREEVERYRQAERKLEAHPDPYAHGRMVPVHRQIEQKSDSAERMPWTKATKEGEVSVSSPPRSNANSNEAEKVSASWSQRRGSQMKEKKVEVTAESSGDTAQKPARTHSSGSTSTSNSQKEWNAKGEAHYQGRGSKVHAAPAASRISREKHSLSIQSSGVDSKASPTAPQWEWSSDSYATKARSKPADNRFKIINFSEEVEDPVESVSATALKPAVHPPVPPEPPVPPRAPGWNIKSGHYQTWSFDIVPNGSSDSPAQRTRSKASKASERDAWYDESVVRTIDTRSSRYYETSGSGGGPAGSNAKPPRSAEDSSKAHRHRMHPDPDLEMTYIPAARRDSHGAPVDLGAKTRKGLPYPEHDVTPEAIVTPSDKGSKQAPKNTSSRSNRTVRDNDREYLYAERIVQPAHRPLGRRPFDNHPPARHVEVEEVVEWRRTPKVAQRSEREHERKSERTPPARPRRGDFSKPERPEGYDMEAIASSYERTADGRKGNRPVEKHSTARVAAKRDDTVPPRTTYKQQAISVVSKPPHEYQPTPPSLRKDQDSDRQDPRVQFSSKVDISPTPPGSDASSSEIYKFHKHFGKAAQKGVEQIDGNQSPEREQVVDYEQRGRMRDRRSEAGYSRGEEHWSLRERASGADDQLRSTRRAGERRHERRGERALTRALSESPSRELLTSLKADSTEPEHNKVQPRREKVDGRGPYREPEKITDSMRVEDGSSLRKPWDGRDDSGHGHGWW